MKLRYTTLTLVAAVAAAFMLASACASEAPTGIVPDDSPLPSTGAGNNLGTSAQAFFVDNVHAELLANCGECHAPANEYNGPEWLLPNAEDAYSMLKSYVSAGGDSMVKGPDCAHLTIYPVSSEHAGPTLAGDTLAVVTDWLKREALEADGALNCGSSTEPEDPATPGPLQQCTDALEGFRACMSNALWHTTGIYDFPNQNTDQGRCHTCHGTCLAGACLTEDPDDWFYDHKDSEINIVKLVRCVIDDNEFLGLAAADRYVNKCVEQTIYASGETHPTCAIQQQRLDGHDSFIQQTIDATKNGTCAELDAAAIAELEQLNQ